MARRKSKYGSEAVKQHNGGAQYLLEQDVYEAALERMRWIYKEFDGKVQISNSGGKDSTVVIELASIAARELGYLPIRVMWLDQECEFASTVEQQRYYAYERDDIDFHWYQVPFDIENATNHQDPWLHVWGEGEEWVREKEPSRAEGGLAIHENNYGLPQEKNQFYALLSAIANQDLEDGWCLIDGMRIEESPARRMSMTSRPVYKWITWVGNDGTKKHPRYRFHPIYDWSYKDVWHFIETRGIKYCKHYDHMFQQGVPTQKMRVSNYTHETALPSLTWLQEIEPQTWEAATRRLQGINTYKHIFDDSFPKKLPYMFASWDEYCRYLIENLTDTDEQRAKFYKQYADMQRSCGHLPLDELAQWQILGVLRSDYYGTTIRNFIVNNRTNRQTGMQMAKATNRKAKSDAAANILQTTEKGDS